jgi:hypothetical protein
VGDQEIVNIDASNTDPLQERVPSFVDKAGNEINALVDTMLTNTLIEKEILDCYIASAEKLQRIGRSCVGGSSMLPKVV